MKILIISHEYPPVGGGGANACMHLSEGFAEKGHEVHIVTIWFRGEKEKEQILGKNGGCVYLHRLYASRKYAEHCSFLEMLDYISKAMPYADKLEKTEKFDICMVFFGIPSGPIGYALKKRYCLPYVIRFGGGDIPGFQERFKTVYRILSPFVKWIWKNADALVANSIGLCDFAYAFYDKKKIDIIPNGADLRVAAEESIRLKEKENGELNILFVSRLIERKGLQDFLPQLPEMRRSCEEKGYRIRLMVIGDGPYRETLESLAKDLGITDIIEFCGQKLKSELPQYYREADLFILPSHREGMPNVVLEAMSFGLPIVMTPCEGSEELIDGNGYAVPVREFGKVILELCGNVKLGQMAEKSRRLVEEKFLWEGMAEKYINIFNAIIKNDARIGG